MNWLFGFRETESETKTLNKFDILCRFVLVKRLIYCKLTDVKCGISGAIDERCRELVCVVVTKFSRNLFIAASFLEILCLYDCVLCRYLVPRLLRLMRGASGGKYSMEELHSRHLLGFC